MPVPDSGISNQTKVNKMSVNTSCSKATNEFHYTGVSFALLLFRLVCKMCSWAPNENIVQNHSDIALLNVF